MLRVHGDAEGRPSTQEWMQFTFDDLTPNERRPGAALGEARDPGHARGRRQRHRARRGARGHLQGQGRRLAHALPGGAAGASTTRRRSTRARSGSRSRSRRRPPTPTSASRRAGSRRTARPRTPSPPAPRRSRWARPTPASPTCPRSRSRSRSGARRRSSSVPKTRRPADDEARGPSCVRGGSGVGRRDGTAADPGACGRGACRGVRDAPAQAAARARRPSHGSSASASTTTSAQPSTLYHEERDRGELEARDHRGLGHQRGDEHRGPADPLEVERGQEDAEDGAVEQRAEDVHRLDQRAQPARPPGEGDRERGPGHGGDPRHQQVAALVGDVAGQAPLHVHHRGRGERVELGRAGVHRRREHRGEHQPDRSRRAASPARTTGTRSCCRCRSSPDWRPSPAPRPPGAPRARARRPSSAPRSRVPRTRRRGRGARSPARAHRRRARRGRRRARLRARASAGRRGRARRAPPRPG